MIPVPRTILVVFSLLLISGCGAHGGPHGRFLSDCADAEKAGKIEVDWADARSIDMVISDDEFSPMILNLSRDRPYRLRIFNDDPTEHILHANLFFQSVSVEGFTLDGRSWEDSCIQSIVIPAGATVEARLVPLREGRFEFSGRYVPLPEWGFSLGVIHVTETAPRRRRSEPETENPAEDASETLSPADDSLI